MDLYRRIDEVLFYKWDPIGISDTDWSRDEYQMYLPTVFKHALEDQTPEPLIQYLSWVVTERMGLDENLEHDKNIAELIFLLKDRCLEQDE